MPHNKINDVNVASLKIVVNSSEDHFSKYSEFENNSMMHRRPMVGSINI